MDIGGEGRYSDAWNLNPRATRTLGVDSGLPIPNLIKGSAEAIPLPDSSVELILVERTPLREQSFLEIARIAAPTARVILRHARPPWSDPHQRAARYLGPPIQQRRTRIGAQEVQESEFVIQSKTEDGQTPHETSLAHRLNRNTPGQICPIDSVAQLRP